MQQNSNKLKEFSINYCVGNIDILSQMAQVPAMPVYSEQVVDFFSKLSIKLLKDKRTKKYPDILSYAFWIRRSSLEQEREKHLSWKDRIGRGVTFHIAPSNVPVNFVVSMTSAMLAGNACVIRISNKEFPQVGIVCDNIKQLLEDEFYDLKQYICIVRYEHNDDINQVISEMCDVRIIWGGNNTISQIRKTTLPPRSIEMAFADRYSIAVIDADFYLEQDLEKVAKDFYTDTYYSDQNACSSPRMVIWLGEKKYEARKKFWSKLEEIVMNEYEMKPIQAVDKFDSFCVLAANMEGVKLVGENNIVQRVEVPQLTPKIMEYKNGGGYFFEYEANELEEIVPMLSKSCQTIAYLGVEKERIQNIVRINGVRGVDRIMPVGKTMELQFIWDGYDMIETMSRVIKLE